MIWWIVAAIVNGIAVVLVILVLVWERAARARERAFVDFMVKQTIERIASVQQFGTPTPKPPEIARTIDAEERVQRMISEATIQRGMQNLRDTVYRGQAVEDDVLRSEVLSMLGGNEPTVELLHVPRD